MPKKREGDCNARIGLKSTVMHYKTIKFNIKIPQNIHNFHFCGALRAKSLILRLCAKRADFFWAVFTNPPPPPLKEYPGYALSKKYPFTGDLGNTHAVPPTPGGGGGAGDSGQKMVQCDQGRIQEFEKGGGGGAQHTVFFGPRGGGG